MTEIKFDKYQKRGANYHWQQVKNNLFSFNAYVFARYQQVLKHIPRDSSLKILDIGCGEGVLLNLIFKKTAASVIGVDPETQPASKDQPIKIIKATAYKLPFKNNSFDIVISTEVIEHLKIPTKMLSEIKRVLKPKGKAIITTPIKLFEKPEDPLHVQEFTTSQLQKLLKKHFSKVIIKTSHPYILKKIYTTSWFRLGRFYFEPVRWLINLIYFIFKLNPFHLTKPKPSQQIANCQK